MPTRQVSQSSQDYSLQIIKKQDFLGFFTNKFGLPYTASHYIWEPHDQYKRPTKFILSADFFMA